MILLNSSRRQGCRDKRFLRLLEQASALWHFSDASDILAGGKISTTIAIGYIEVLTGGARPLSRGIGCGGIRMTGAPTGSAQNQPILKNSQNSRRIKYISLGDLFPRKKRQGCI